MRENEAQTFNVSTDYCGQGVSVYSSVSIAPGSNAFVKTVIKDGKGNEIGTFVVNDSFDSVYLDLKGTSKMKRRTLCNLMAKLKEHLEEAFKDLLRAEDDGSNSNGSETAGSGDADPVSGEE